MRRGFVPGLVVLAASFAGDAARAQDAKDAAPPAAYDLGDAKHLKVLYAGALDTPRAKSFVAFLKANFEKVGELDVAQLSKSTAAPWDVVVCDAKRIYPMGEKPSLDLPKVDLGHDFTKPIVMLGAMGGTVQHHTKIDWL